MTRRGASVAYGYEGEAESRRKVDDGDDAAWCACASVCGACEERERRDRRKVGRGMTSQREAAGRQGGTTRGHLRGELQRARIGAHCTVHAPSRGVGETRACVGASV